MAEAHTEADKSAAPGPRRLSFASDLREAPHAEASAVRFQ